MIIAEAAPRAGGCLYTRKSPCGHFLYDVGANSFRLTRGTLKLVQDLGLLSQLQRVDPRLERFIGFRGGLRPLPFSSLPALFTSDLLSRSGKLRLLAGLCGIFPPRFLWNLMHPSSSPSAPMSCASPSSHPFVSPAAAPFSPPSPSSGFGDEEGRRSLSSVVSRLSWGQPRDETVEEFISRRLGPEMHSRILDALVTGICAGDASQLSMKATLPAAHRALDRGVIVYALQSLAAKIASVWSPKSAEMHASGEGAARATMLPSRDPEGRNEHGQAEQPGRTPSAEEGGKHAHSMRVDPHVATRDMQGIVNFDDGMETLTNALVANLPVAAPQDPLPACRLRLQWKLKALRCFPADTPEASFTSGASRASGASANNATSSASGSAAGASLAPSSPPWFEALFETPEGLRRVHARQVLLTIPAEAVASAMRSSLSPSLLGRLAALPQASMALVTLAYSKPRLQHIVREDGSLGILKANARHPGEEQYVFEDDELPRKKARCDTPSPSSVSSSASGGDAEDTAEASNERTRRQEDVARSRLSLGSFLREREKPSSLGFGFLLPGEERIRHQWKTLGGIFVSDVFHGRVPASSDSLFEGAKDGPNSDVVQEEVSLVTMFVGGIRDGDVVLTASDVELGEAARDDFLRAFASLSAAGDAARSLSPDAKEKMKLWVSVLNVQRWASTIPQYVTGHDRLKGDLQAEIADRFQVREGERHEERLIVEGNWLSGAAVGDRIDAGERAGQGLLSNAMIRGGSDG
ncbi:Protoporphyrinogen oxidase, related [Neospora caninum Liverpool]|nr:Protoporphyrinogen oxidase, related [Neospora caninum Liverpool]CBZ53702.1 Protoporphyrinogen oxidase, related [Neospora caninum Liverpool]|eukprot:XP_003883734.1 Protoporphyrinogen oxidase, related [Neospora caninum Liverpool]